MISLLGIVASMLSALARTIRRNLTCCTTTVMPFMRSVLAATNARQHDEESGIV